ncbi:hypothetical protein GT045_19120 [Streptomyces sp. SID486]|uniref:hypothetical protein n=1 Tax=Streptomyces sp. SID486 TaxID=2690264 RepID=UPI00136E7BE5|nr:hypothetical protein [Streptomyces sp. SID486]MYX95146.1 hypothetical protein [Streptomyces sp. SID486]MYX96541.1 hypothetical protein [Streptomyces sp. SID486]MYX96869.1 hypothetical protein [Streptomyces sp. SID486]
MLHDKVRKAVQAAGVIGAATVLGLATSTSASAHVVYQDEEVWSNSDSSKCEYTYSEVSHGGRGGYTKTQGHAGQNGTGIGGCIFPYERPAGNLEVGYQYMKYNGSTWYVCREYMSGIYNTKKTSILTTSYDFGVYPPCGGGDYATKAGSGLYYGGTWYGRNVPIWSGSHFIEP